MEKKRFSLGLSSELIDKIDALKSEWGLRSRGAIVERLLQELFGAELLEDAYQDQVDASTARQPTHPDHQQPSLADGEPSVFNEKGALVLVAKGESGDLVLDVDQADPGDFFGSLEQRSSRSSGIDLPGFVRKQSAQLRQSLSPSTAAKAAAAEPLPSVGPERVERCLDRARSHWLELYGTTANEAVVEAAMVWLASDIWRQSDQSDGRPFTWSLACSVVECFAPSWPKGEPSFEAVIVMAGLLEDPFSTSTLEMRIPTLIRRFVHRFRKRKAGTSFQTLEHTMTLHGALKLLQLPTAPGHRLTLGHIRDAYREMALRTHPDSGGSEEDMRKLNEAYQLLKELYRNS